MDSMSFKLKPKIGSPLCDTLMITFNSYDPSGIMSERPSEKMTHAKTKTFSCEVFHVWME